MNYLVFINASVLLIVFGCKSVLADSIGDAIKEAGYPVEIYSVETKDGYKLRLHRIPHGINKLHYDLDSESSKELNSSETKQTRTTKNRKEVVLLVHGLMTSGIFWVVGDRHKALAYMLADAGYDVWIFSSRSTSFTRHHAYTDDDKEYWNFSWHEIGHYDIPSVIDAILIKTGAKQLKYIGHSQGCTVFFVLLTTKPSYNNKISSAYLLAPAVFLHGMTSMVKPLTNVATTIFEFAKNLGIYAFVPNSAASQILMDFFCKQLEQTTEMCMKSFFLVVGDGGQIKDKNAFIQFVTKSISDSVSMKQLLHFGQITKSGKFQKFDYVEDNLRHYGSKKPPEYDLGLVTVPVTIFYGSQDVLLPIRGVQQLVKKLSKIQNLVELPWGHLDFVYGEDVDVYVNDHIIRSMIAEAENRTYLINLPNGTTTLDSELELETEVKQVGNETL